jgi:hypothetical protein
MKLYKKIVYIVVPDDVNYDTLKSFNGYWKIKETYDFDHFQELYGFSDNDRYKYGAFVRNDELAYAIDFEYVMDI